MQMSMIEAFGVLADRVKDLEAVVGFEVSSVRSEVQRES